MADNEEYTGICSTCAYAPSCAHRQRSDKPVWYCEEFDNFIPAPKKAASSGLISILEDIQGKYGYLPQGALVAVADKTNRSLVDIYGVATFYKSFSLIPRGKHLISVCLGTACHVRSAPVIVEEFERQLGINAGSTTEDREFSLETVNCLGACALGPIVVADGHYFSNVNTSNVNVILIKTRAGLDKVKVKTIITIAASSLILISTFSTSLILTTGLYY